MILHLCVHGIFMVYFMKSWRSIHDSWTHHEGFMNKFRAVQLWGFPDPCSGYPSRLSPWQQPHGWAGSQGCCERASGEAWGPWRSSAVLWIICFLFAQKAPPSVFLRRSWRAPGSKFHDVTSAKLGADRWQGSQDESWGACRRASVVTITNEALSE